MYRLKSFIHIVSIPLSGKVFNENVEHNPEKWNEMFLFHPVKNQFIYRKIKRLYHFGFSQVFIYDVYRNI